VRYPAYVAFRDQGEAVATGEAAALEATTAEPGALMSLDTAPPKTTTSDFSKGARDEAW
jgi:hypothetical protein